MKKPVLILIIFLLVVAPLLSTHQASAAANLRNVSISVELLSSVYDEFVAWVQPIAQSFHNFTIILLPDVDSAYGWFLWNQTRIHQLSQIGEVIPGTGYLQAKSPQDRIDFLNLTLNSWKTYVGSLPSGFFMFQPDTLSINYLNSRQVNYVVGYCFDQYQVDWMSMRGGWQLPYYASHLNALMPENQSSRGVVVLPWLTWDWRDSFTLSHNFNTHPVDTVYTSIQNTTDYILKLLRANLDASSPVAYGAFSFEFSWIQSLNITDKVSDLLASIIGDGSYEKLSVGNFSQWFKASYATTPAYKVNFTSPYSNGSIEWFFDVNSRVARMDGRLVSYVRYQNQAADKFLNATAVLDINWAKMGPQGIDTSLRFTIDALGGGDLRAPPLGIGFVYPFDLSDFPSYYESLLASMPLVTPPSGPTDSSGFQPLSLVAVVGFFCVSIWAVFAVKLKSKRPAVLFLVIILFAFTISLRGVAPKTYVQTEIPASDLNLRVVSYDFFNGSGWSVNDFSADLRNWKSNDNNSVLRTDGKILSLVDPGNAQSPQAIILSRNLSIGVFQLPICVLNISVSEGAAYHVRFVGRDSAGVERQVWWETSPLDDILGKSRWETNAVDMFAFSSAAIGEVVSVLTSVQIILDKPFYGQISGERSLNVSSIGFYERNLKVTQFPGDSIVSSNDLPIQAVIIDLPSHYVAQGSWNVLWASVTYRLTADESTSYKMALLARGRGALIDGPYFLSHQSSFTDIYKLETLSIQSSRSQQVNLFSSIAGEFSIAIVRNSWDGQGFSSFALDSVEVAASKAFGGGG